MSRNLTEEFILIKSDCSDMLHSWVGKGIFLSGNDHKLCFAIAL